MMRKAVCVLLVFLLLRSWFSLAEASGAEMITLKRLDGGKDFKVPVGTVIQIELEEKGATGYLWHLDALDQRIFDLDRVESKGSERKGVTGAPVTKVWRLKTKHTGKTRLEFSYCRPWEGKEAALDRFEVGIVIE